MAKKPAKPARKSPANEVAEPRGQEARERERAPPRTGKSGAEEERPTCGEEIDTSGGQEARHQGESGKTGTEEETRCEAARRQGEVGEATAQAQSRGKTRAETARPEAGTQAQGGGEARRQGGQARA